MTFRYERVPRSTILIGVIGTPLFAMKLGWLSALGFAVGVLGSWWNYKGLVKSVIGLTSAAAAGQAPNTLAMVGGLFFRMAVLAAGAIAILKLSKVSLIALAVGLFASLIAICLEIIFDVLWVKSTKSG